MKENLAWVGLGLALVALLVAADISWAAPGPDADPPTYKIPVSRFSGIAANKKAPLYAKMLDDYLAAVDELPAGQSCPSFESHLDDLRFVHPERKALYLREIDLWRKCVVRGWDEPISLATPCNINQNFGRDEMYDKVLDALIMIAGTSHVACQRYWPMGEQMGQTMRDTLLVKEVRLQRLCASPRPNDPALPSRKRVGLTLEACPRPGTAAPPCDPEILPCGQSRRCRDARLRQLVINREPANDEICLYSGESLLGLTRKQYKDLSRQRLVLLVQSMTTPNWITGSPAEKTDHEIVIRFYNLQSLRVEKTVRPSDTTEGRRQ